MNQLPHVFFVLPDEPRSVRADILLAQGSEQVIDDPHREWHEDYRIEVESDDIQCRDDRQQIDHRSQNSQRIEEQRTVVNALMDSLADRLKPVMDLTPVPIARLMVGRLDQRGRFVFERFSQLFPESMPILSSCAGDLEGFQHAAAHSIQRSIVVHLFGDERRRKARTSDRAQR